MYLTEKEILDTPNALQRTCTYFDEKDAAIKHFFSEYPRRKFVFFGCGSSYMLAKSAATIFSNLLGTEAYAIPAGDYIVHPDFWKDTVTGSTVVALSRSGKTSEMVRAIKHIRAELACPVISISMLRDNDLSALSELSLILDWCYDESVCQTRTVTNLYVSTLLLAAKYIKNPMLVEFVKQACRDNENFLHDHRSCFEEIAKQNWENVVVLADGEICGLAEEGALAFTEIAMLTGRYFHLLDYRHGPIVVSDERTLTIILLRPDERDLQLAMVRDVCSHGGPVITISEQSESVPEVAAHIQIANNSWFATWGISFIYTAQMIALLKAIELGNNPDAPQGLDAYITL